MIPAMVSSWAPIGTESTAMPTFMPASREFKISIRVEITTTPTSAPGEAALAAHDQHGEQNEGNGEPEILDRDGAEVVRLQHAADAHEEGAQHEGDEALARGC